MRPDKVLETLQSAGYEAWYVGGCVRDTLLGRPIHDWDITTSALPEQVLALFPRTVPTGLPHGTVTVLSDVGPVEVTTYRADGAYHDGRHPDAVRFVRAYSDAPEQVDPEDVFRRLEPIRGHPEFHFYLPLEREIGLFSFEIDDQQEDLI